MKKGELNLNRGIFILILLVMFVFIVGVVIAGPYDDPGDSSDVFVTEESGGEDDEEGDEWVTEGVESPEDEYFTETGLPGHQLIQDLRIYCHYDGRKGFEIVPSEEDGMYKDATFVIQEYYQGAGYLFCADNEGSGKNQYDCGNEVSYYSGELLPWFLMKDSDFYIDGGITSWSKPIYIDLEPEDQRMKAKLYRFEGEPNVNSGFALEHGCVPAIKNNHYVDYTEELFDSPVKFAYHQKDGMLRNTESSYFNLYSSQGYDVLWEDEKEHCELIGGDYMGEQGIYFSMFGVNYGCCGDDRIWIMNKAMYEDEEEPFISSSDLSDIYEGIDDDSLHCLYNSFDMPLQDVDSVINLGEEVNSGEYAYTCLETFFSAYDLSLEFDDLYDPDEVEEEEEIVVGRYAPFVFDDSGDYETDIGKWSDGAGDNPYFCSYSFEDYVEDYEWLDINTAGELFVNAEGEELSVNEKEDSICERFLGGVWTGSHCCGNKYDYDDGRYVNETFSDPEWSGAMDYDNLACVQGEAVENGHIAVMNQTADGDDVDSIELLNANGTLYGCHVNTPMSYGFDYYKEFDFSMDRGLGVGNLGPAKKDKASLLDSDYLIGITFMGDSTNKPYCYVMEEDQVCGAINNTWLSVSGEYADDVMGYTGNWSAILSEAPWAEDLELEHSQECCFGGKCWNGTTCVTEYSWYAQEADNETVNYVCSGGDWKEVGAKYNWYYNTEADTVDYCIEEYSCVCSQNDEDDTFCSYEGEYFEAGCTLVENFFKDDHLCEALDTNGDGAADDSRWTSRTKFIAMQMMSIGGTEYKLYCDNYVDALVNYLPVDTIPEFIPELVNSFCVLETSDKTVIGVSFNSDDEDEPMNIDSEDVLFGSSNGFISAILDDDDVGDCDDAIAYSSAYTFGEYVQCEDDNAWYNNATRSLIYSVDGLTITSVTDFTSYQDELDAYADEIITHVSNHEDDIEDLILSSDPYQYIADFNNLYLAKVGSKTIFGVEEKRFDSEISMDNRNYLAVTYEGTSVDCEQIEDSYASKGDDVYCYGGEPVIVLERTVSGSEHWQSLTSKLRLS